MTMKDLEEESRAIADDRARLLRKENTSRRKAREELRLMAEREEQERFRAALEDRKRELEEKRSLITAGPRVKPCELCFDNVSTLPPASLGLKAIPWPLHFMNVQYRSVGRISLSSTS